ncbi:phosphatidylcholine and lysophosphatidylcholine phospholipase, partial [Rhizoclosmatium hyalinum]
MPLSSPKALHRDIHKKTTLMDLQAHFQRFYSQATGRLLNPNARTSPNAHTGIRSDFARIARRLLNKSIGLALGGGGARGIAHVAIIRALEEAGVPIDMIGGTSIGSFVAGLYARENDHVSIYGRAKQLSMQMCSKWRQLLDLTYPLTSLFTGHELNRAIFKSFHETQIEDCWLPYFAVSVNITDSRVEIHRSGYMWRYVRASMSLAGYFPPLCDNGKMLVDGGYLNLVPVDIVIAKGADVAIAVDVSLWNDTSPVTYGDSLSG